MSIWQFIEKCKHKMRGARGNRYTWESPVFFGGHVSLGSNVHIGKFTYITSGKIYPNVKIGRYCSIAMNVVIGATSHPLNWLSSSTFQYEKKDRFKTFDTPLYFEDKADTYIGNDVWIGANVVVKNGLIVGDGAVIGAGAVVTKDVPPYTIVTGVPAKIARYRFDEEIICKLLSLKWWDLDIKHLKGLQYSEINKCIEEIKQRMGQS